MAQNDDGKTGAWIAAVDHTTHVSERVHLGIRLSHSGRQVDLQLLAALKYALHIRFTILT